MFFQPDKQTCYSEFGVVFAHSLKISGGNMEDGKPVPVNKCLADAVNALWRRMKSSRYGKIFIYFPVTLRFVQTNS